MRRDIQALILLLLGGTLLKISLTGSYLRYVKPGQLPLLVAAGVVLVAVAAVALWPDPGRRGRPDPHQAGDHGGAAHAEHAHPGSRAGWLLIVPALVLLAFAPPAIGSFQASRNGTALSAQVASDFAPLPEGDPVRVSVLDYATRAVFDEGRSLQGRTVTMSGFVIAGPDGAPYLARMVVTCCAADARPIKVGLAGDLPGLAPDEWIEVDGSYTDRVDHDPVNDEPIPYVLVAAVRPIPAPEAGYET